MKKLYIASPFFSDRETEVLSRVENILKGRGFDVFSPRENEVRSGDTGTPEWSLATFENDRNAIDRCDAVVMLYWGNYSDSGTAWECGYAYGKGKPVAVVHLGDTSNLMVHEGSHTNLMSVEELEDYDFENPEKRRFSGKMY